MAAVTIMASEGATYNCYCIHIKRTNTATVDIEPACERHTETIARNEPSTRTLHEHRRRHPSNLDQCSEKAESPTIRQRGKGPLPMEFSLVGYVNEHYPLHNYNDEFRGDSSTWNR